MIHLDSHLYTSKKNKKHQAFTHHWQLVKIEQLFDETSEHVLTLPHLIQGPKSNDPLHSQKTREKKINILPRWSELAAPLMHCFYVVSEYRLKILPTLTLFESIHKSIFMYKM